MLSGSKLGLNSIDPNFLFVKPSFLELVKLFGAVVLLRDYFDIFRHILLNFVDVKLQLVYLPL